MPRFSIRDVLLATAIIALSLGWWLDHQRLAAQLAILLIDNGVLKQDNERLSEIKRVSEQFVRRQRIIAEEQRQEAIARLKAKGFKFSPADEKPLFPEERPSQ